MKIAVPLNAILPLCLLTARPCQAQVTTGYSNAGTAADVTLGGSSFTWNTPNGALASGGGTASTTALLSAYTGKTDYLQVTNFGFSLPTGATIDGIQVQVTRVASGLSLTVAGITITGSVTDNIVQLVGPGVTSVNKASGASWPTSSGTATYGATNDVWGPTTWTAAMVNSAAFGVQLSGNMNGGTLLGFDLVPGAAVDYVTINITYSNPVTLALALDQWSVTPAAGNANLLSWQAPVGQAPGTYTVERSANGIDWTPLATIAAAAGRQQYDYTDDAPFATGPTCYRLRLQAAGQADSWSTVQALSARTLRPMISTYPNPFHNTINISAARTFSRVMLTNQQGVRLWVKEFPGGVTNTQIPVTGLPQGLYFLTVDGATWRLVKG